MYDMLKKYILNALIEIFKKMEEQKRMVTKSKPNSNNTKKTLSILTGTITEFDLDGRRQGKFFLDWICQAGKPVIC